MDKSKYIKVIYNSKKFGEFILVKKIIKHLLKTKKTKRKNKQCIEHNDKNVVIDFFDENIRKNYESDIDPIYLNDFKLLTKRHKRMISGIFEDWFDYASLKESFDKEMDNITRKINKKAFETFVIYELTDPFFYVSKRNTGYHTVRVITKEIFMEKMWKYNLNNIYLDPIKADKVCLEKLMETKNSYWYKDQIKAEIKDITSYARQMKNMERIKKTKINGDD